MARTGIDINRAFAAVNGSPVFNQTVAYGASTASTALTPGKMYIVQPTTDCYIRTGGGNTGISSVSSANGMFIAANEKFYLTLYDDEGRGNGGIFEDKIYAIQSSAAGSLLIHELR